jgi:hypothetical protein
MLSISNARGYYTELMEARIGHAAERPWLCWMSCGGSPWGRMGLFAVAAGACRGDGGFGGPGDKLFILDLKKPCLLYLERV